MEIRKILLICLVMSLVLLAPFAPTTITVFAATSDTITITFDPQGNISIDVDPGTYNFTQVWAYQNDSTTEHYFTMWNNGTTDGMLTEVRATTSPAGLSNDNNSVPDGDDEYALNVTQGTVEYTLWVPEHTYVTLDTDLDRSGTETFGLNLYLSNITTNLTWQTLVLTLRGSSV